MKRKQDNEKNNRLEKIAATAVGVVAGGALLHKTGDLKNLSKAFGDASHVMKKVANDIKVTGLKNMDAEKTSEVFHNRIKNSDSTWRIKRSAAPEIDLKTTFFKDLMDSRNRDFSGEFKLKRQDAEIKKHAFNRLDDLFKNTKERDKDLLRELHVLTNEALNKKAQYFELSGPGEYTPILSEFQDRLKGTRLEGNEGKIASVLKEALDNSDTILNNMEVRSQDVEEDFSKKLQKAVKEKYENKKRVTTDDRAATAKDIYEALQEQKATAKNGDGAEFVSELGKLIEADKEIGELVVDPTRYRMDANNQFYSLADLRNTADKAQDAFSETIMGKLLWTKNRVTSKNAPLVNFWAEGSFDPGLAAILGGKDVLKKDVVMIDDKFYEFGKTGLKHIEAADGRRLASKDSNTHTFMKRISGNANEKYQENYILKALDINTRGGDAFSSFLSRFTKFKSDGDGRDWAPNLSKRLVAGYDVSGSITGQKVRSFDKDLKAMSQMYNNNTKAANVDTIEKLQSTFGEKSGKILKAMQSEDPLAAYVAIQGSPMNKDLKSIINKVEKDESLKETMTRSSYGHNGKRVLKYDEIVKRELLKEALFVETVENGGRQASGYAVTLSKLERTGLSKPELDNMKDLMNWSIIQDKGKMFAKDVYAPKTIEEKYNTYMDMNTLFRGKNSNAQEDYFLQSFKKSVLEFGKKNSSITEELKINPNTKVGYESQEWMTVKKSINPLKIIESINDGTKQTGNMVTDFIKQFGAGRNNMEDVTAATMAGYHMLNRLTTPLEGIGLGFSNASTGSSLDLVKNIGLKRILPAAGIAMGASYLNYRAEAYTGTSFTQAFQNAKAQFGVGIRMIGSPLNGYLERQRTFNPIADYWLGDHKDKDEYLDYLENGYDPVRKGRFWSFGSSSEFRGGKISYWEPNKLRQAHSNYKDIALYGSTEEKWKHSFIPTPRHPLSTIRYLMNPYWLEDKHYEDRPYPVSGKMFSEGTPWGAILNPTIGQLIKPQRRMHQRELQGTALDVRSIIKERNDRVKESAQENRLIRIDESGITPMMFTPSSMPSGSESVYTIKVDGGRVVSHGYAGQDYAEGMTSFGDAEFASRSNGVTVDSIGHVRYGVQRLNSTNDYDNKATASWLSGIASLLTSNAVSGQEALSMIKQVNDSTRNSVASARSGEWFEKGRLHVQPSRARADRMKLDHVNDMIEFNTKKDFVDDMMYSTKQLSGMYGFLFEQIVPSKRGMRWENAGKMGSFTRTFWDESYGGIGGNFMEIARRFFPHENHNIEDINPIRNTMEEWLPQRFQTGDPYTKVTKGEARLPGAGYEALHRLHSDEYGRYGALDRMKILGDVAPLSEEYKIWKKIAKANYTDAYSKKFIAGIEERAKAQTKEHDFYNYKFLGTKMNEKSVVISEMSNTGTFKVIGSEQEFSLAGIKPMNNEEGNSMVHDYLKPGMKVQIKFEDNAFRNKNEEGRISAIVQKDGENVNEQMVRSGAAKENETKSTLADEIYNVSDLNITTGHLWEAIGHAPIPFIHNKFMRINSSLESYKHEQVYGTPYSTWDHPIKGFINPALNEAWSQGPVKQAVGIGAWALSSYAKDNLDGTAKLAANAFFAAANPGAFAGGVIGSIPRMRVSSEGVWNTRNGANIGAAVALAGYMAVNTQNPLLSAANFAVLGMAAQAQFKFKGSNGLIAAGAGAAVGLALSGLNEDSKIWNLNKKYLPEDTEKKWEIEEYYDRLEYMKYTNLYLKAAKQAKRREGVDIESIVNKYERNKEKNAKLIKKLEEQKLKADKMIDESAREQLIANIDAQINSLMTPIQYLSGGEYTKAAIAYKKAADTTIYGLSEDASTADVLRALPQYDRDFFLDFANENDPKKRKEILKYVSPYKAKALKIMWGEEADKQESNHSFFQSYNLPNMFWGGWRSDVDLENVKMKTIENEGMLLSDFGMYDSNRSTPAAMAAPEIKDMHNGTSPVALQANMLSLLSGAGFNGVDVSVEPSSRPGIQMVANVARTTTYGISNSVSSVLGKLLL